MANSPDAKFTGAKDPYYNIIWFTEICMSNVMRLQTYIEEAEKDGDQQLLDFFLRAQAESRKGADQGKKLLAQRLARGT